MEDPARMKVSTMRRIDSWLGLPACAVLTAWRWLARLFGSRHAGAPERILFVKLAEQGSTVLAVSAFRGAIDRVGRENVYFLCFEENRFILDLMDLIPVDNVITIRSRGLPGTVISALRAIVTVRRLGLDTAVDLEFFARSSAAISYLGGARNRVGFHAFGGEGPSRGDLMTHRLRYNPHLHTTQTFRLMVDALDEDPDQLPTMRAVPPAADDPAPPFAPSESEVAGVRRLLVDVGGGPIDGPLVLLNANCSDLLPLRAWPRERYVELARRLLDRFPDVRIGMTGAPDEAAPVRALVESIGSDRCFSLAGRTTLRELLVIYTLSAVLVTNDSGPAHFATLTPIEVITLFGPETPALFAARSPRNHVIWAGVACSPCVSALNNRVSPCRNNLCMQAIDVGRVESEIARLLRNECRASLNVVR
jgi:ADP-heptose:LPS heptosyltransferase